MSAPSNTFYGRASPLPILLRRLEPPRQALLSFGDYVKFEVAANEIYIESLMGYLFSLISVRCRLHDSADMRDASSRCLGDAY